MRHDRHGFQISRDWHCIPELWYKVIKSVPLCTSLPRHLCCFSDICIAIQPGYRCWHWGRKKPLGKKCVKGGLWHFMKWWLIHLNHCHFIFTIVTFSVSNTITSQVSGFSRRLTRLWLLDIEIVSRASRSSKKQGRHVSFNVFHQSPYHPQPIISSDVCQIWSASSSNVIQRHPTSSNVNGLPNGLPPRSSICGSTEYTEGAKGWSASGHHLNTPVRNEAWYWRWSWMKPAKKVPKDVEVTEKAKELRPRNCHESVGRNCHRSIDCSLKNWHHCALHLQLPEALPHSGSAFNADTHHSEKVRAPQPLLLTQKRLFGNNLGSHTGNEIVWVVIVLHSEWLDCHQGFAFVLIHGSHASVTNVSKLGNFKIFSNESKRTVIKNN